MAPGGIITYKCPQCRLKGGTCWHRQPLTINDNASGTTVSTPSQTESSTSATPSSQGSNQLPGPQTDPEYDFTRLMDLEAYYNSPQNTSSSQTTPKPKRKRKPKRDPDSSLDTDASQTTPKPKRRKKRTEDSDGPLNTSTPETPTIPSSRTPGTACGTCSELKLRCTHPEPFVARSYTTTNPPPTPRTNSIPCDECRRRKRKCTHNSDPFAPENNTSDAPSRSLVPDAMLETLQPLLFTRTPVTLPPALQYDSPSSNLAPDPTPETEQPSPFTRDSSDPQTPTKHQRRKKRTSCEKCRTSHVRCTHPPAAHPMVVKPFVPGQPLYNSACETCRERKQKCTHNLPPVASENDTANAPSSNLTPDPTLETAQPSLFTRTPAALPPAPQQDEASLGAPPALQYDSPPSAFVFWCVFYQKDVGGDEALVNHYHFLHYPDCIPHCHCFGCITEECSRNGLPEERGID